MYIEVVWHRLAVAVLASLAVLAGAMTRAEAATVRQLVEVVDVSGVSVSPDGRLVAFRTEQAVIERNTYDAVWYVQPVDGTAPPRRLADGGEPLRQGGVSLPEMAVWSPDGRWIFYRALLDGRIDVWRAAVDGSRAEPVTRDAANVRAFSLNQDGTVVRYSVGAPREAVVDAEWEEYDRGIHIDRAVPLGDGLFRSGYHEGRLASQRLVDRGGLDYRPLLSDEPDRWKVVDLATKRVAASVPGGAAGATAASQHAAGLAGVSKLSEAPDTGRVAVLLHSDHAARSTRGMELAMLPAAGTAGPVRCDAPACRDVSITDILWRPGSDEVVFTVADPEHGGGQAIHRWNVATGRVLPVVAARGDLGGGGRWVPGPCGVAFEALVCVAAEADRPPRLERIDLDTGARTVLFEPNAALDRDMAEGTAVQALRWTDARGVAFTGQFFPASGTGEGPAPLFVVYYRCSGFLRGGVGDEWPLATLARQGIAALCINAAPSRTDAVARYEDARHAVESGVDLLSARGDIDRERVGMGGLSLGAGVTMWTAMTSGVLKAASVSSPVAAPGWRLGFSLWEDVHFSRLDRFWQLGAPDETPERWRQLSPSFNLDRFEAPLLTQLSEQEFRYAVEYLAPLIRARRADAYVFAHEPHQKFQPRHKLAVYERNLDWFRYWLQGIEDVDPDKAAQYARWRSMQAGGRE